MPGARRWSHGEAWHNAQMCRGVKQHFVFLPSHMALCQRLYFWLTEAQLLIYHFPPSSTHTKTRLKHPPVTSQVSCKGWRGSDVGEGGACKHPLLTACSLPFPPLHFPRSNKQRQLVLPSVPHPCHHPAACHTNPYPAKKRSPRPF